MRASDITSESSMSALLRIFSSRGRFEHEGGARIASAGSSFLSSTTLRSSSLILPMS